MKPNDYQIDDSPAARVRKALRAAFAACEVRVTPNERLASVCLGRAGDAEVWVDIPIGIRRVRPERLGVSVEDDERDAIRRNGGG